MKNAYTEILEQIIVEMNAASSNGHNQYSDPHCLLWMNFLKQVYPESNLLKDRAHIPMPREPSATKELRVFTDVREIMILAETKRYPTWYVQPKFNTTLLLEYDQGELKNIYVKQIGGLEAADVNEVPGIPRQIPELTGRIAGTCFQNKTDGIQFIANDAENKMDFITKMEFLQNAGFGVAEHVLFPTDKIPTISSSTLEAFFRNYISKAQGQGLPVDGAVIISDSAIVPEDDSFASHRIAFSPV